MARLVVQGAAPSGLLQHAGARTQLPRGAAFRATVKRSGITASGRLSLHSLRHGYASLLIAKGLNLVFVGRQLGHANPTVTLSTYAHLFERADHAQAASEALEASYAATAGPAAP